MDRNVFHTMITQYLFVALGDVDADGFFAATFMLQFVFCVIFALVLKKIYMQFICKLKLF